jgi:5-hydroxyisourate hydrolase-like protein (transthyretin family)
MITAQVIDTAHGRTAALIPVVLDYFVSGQGWRETGSGVTNVEGLVETFGEVPGVGIYRLTFDVAAYHVDPFFPTIAVTFDLRAVDQDCHLALLLGPFSYSVSRA